MVFNSSNKPINQCSDYELLDNSIYFDKEYYKSQNKNITDEDPIKYFLDKGFKEGGSPSKFFNHRWYLNRNSDIKNAGVNPLVHFLRNGKDEHRPYRWEKMDLTKIDEYKNNKRLIEIYDTLYSSLLFDFEYYLKRKPELIRKGFDPILHYILYGVREGLDPNEFFSTTRYLERYVDVANSKINPLYHYIVNGKDENRKMFYPLTSGMDNFDNRYSIKDTNRILKALNRKISIIIPIYNAYEETRECIRSVLQNTNINYELILINDCSTDERINPLLDAVKDIENVKVIQNSENQGFVKNVNIGIKESDGDIVLLNSDTIVTPKWLSNLVVTAYSSPDIGTVTPFCNSSDISITELGENTDTLFLNKNAYQVNKLSEGNLLKAPTGNGFCIFIKRETIDDVGIFDEIFGRGYGEETDFTQRALKRGWKNIRDDSVFIYHRRHASFTKEKTDVLKENNKKILMKRHPEVYSAWDNFVKSDLLRNAVKNIEDNIRPYKNSERILYVTRMENDKIELGSEFNSLNNKYDCYILVPMYSSIKLYRYYKDNLSFVREWNYNHTAGTDYFNKLCFNILASLKIDLVYVKTMFEFYVREYIKQNLYILMTRYLDVKVIYEATANDDLLNQVETELNPTKTLEELFEIKNNQINFNDKKIVVYTAVTGNYDDIIVPRYINPDFDYICFTDNPNLFSDFWEIRQMEDLDLDEVRKARRYKILPHKYLSEYDYSIWVDSNFEITGDLKDYVHRYGVNNQLLAIKHELRDCLYEEKDACISQNKDSNEVMNKQIEKYRNESYPEHNGLVASGILFRNHHDSHVIKVMEDWYHEIVNHSFRDQLSFNYACWKNDFQYDESPLFYYRNEYFLRHDHKKMNSVKVVYNQKIEESISSEFNRPVTIIVNIYDDYEMTKKCLESIRDNVKISYQLVLVKNNKLETNLDKLINTYNYDSNARIVTVFDNEGYLRNINEIIKDTNNDIFLINSNCILTRNSLQRLKFIAYIREDIATVSPLSTESGVFTVPSDDLSIERRANLIEKYDKKLLRTPNGKGFCNQYLITPIANSSCVYIKSKDIKNVGYFDEDLTVENGIIDLSLRLSESKENILDPTVYIYHKNISGNETEELDKDEKLLEKYPSYISKIKDFKDSYDLNELKKLLKYRLNSKYVNQYDKKRILYITDSLHEEETIGLVENINHDFDCYILSSTKEDLKLYTHDKFNKTKQQVGSFKLNKNNSLSEPFNKDYRYIYLNLLNILKIDLVHIQNSTYHSFDIEKTSNKLGIPVILTINDYYYICPSNNLLDNNNQYCGGYCTKLDKNNPQCKVENTNVPVLKTYVHTWRDNVKEMLNNCDLCIIDSSRYELYKKIYPELGNNKVSIINKEENIKDYDNYIRNYTKLMKNYL